MNSKIRNMLTGLITLLLLVITFSFAVGAQSGTVLKNGADRLVQLQKADGGWAWPLTSPPGTPSPPNTIGPIAKGLAEAYLYTNDPAHQAALIKVGAFLLTKRNNFSPSDGYLAATLDKILGGNTYTNHVLNYFYGPLAAGTYKRSGDATLYTTEKYVNRIRTVRSGSQANMAAWDIGIGLVGAASVGADTSAWIAGTKAKINELDGNNYYAVIGLAGAIYGLAFVHEDFDPTAGQFASASNLTDLANILAGNQITSGGFTWWFNYIEAGEEAIQETAYSLLALYAVSPTTYLSNILRARDYLISVQLSTGGWENYPFYHDGENNEVTGEALWAIGFLAQEKYKLTYTAGTGGTISGTSPQTVYYGNSGSQVTAVPATGYHFVSWSDGSTTNPRTDTNVSANITVNASFAPTLPETKDSCKNSGWKNVLRADGSAFKNQGDCIQYFNTGK